MVGRYEDEDGQDWQPPVWLVVVVLAVVALLMVRSMGLEGWIR
jgi:hypothetical protein